MTRLRLPNRRQQWSETFVWPAAPDRGRAYALGVGFTPDGAVREVFLTSPKNKGGSDLEGLLNHACILASLLLQHGASLAEVARTLGCEASVMGAAFVGSLFLPKPPGR